VTLRVYHDDTNEAQKLNWRIYLYACGFHCLFSVLKDNIEWITYCYNFLMNNSMMIYSYINQRNVSAELQPTISRNLWIDGCITTMVYEVIFRNNGNGRVVTIVFLYNIFNFVCKHVSCYIKYKYIYITLSLYLNTCTCTQDRIQLKFNRSLK